MARTGSSSKFVPVNLNNSYGQTVSLPNGGAASTSSLGRSRSFSSSYGGMVSLSRSSRVTSSSSSSATVTRASKLAVPRPVNLPSLRREHSGNDPTITLVGNLGSSGWSRQSGDESVDANALRSDAHKGDTTSWGNRASADVPSQVAERRPLSAGRQSAYSPPGAGDASVYGGPPTPVPVAKAVVFRGEDFPTLQAAAIPSSPSLPPRPRSRDSQHKHRDKHTGSSLEQNSPQRKESFTGDDVGESSHALNRQLQPAQPVQMQTRAAISEQADHDVDRGSSYHRGPSPLIKLTHTSNWADDERETLSSVQTQESVQSEWAERNIGFQRPGNWLMDRNADIDSRRSASKVGYSGRNEPDFSMRTMPSLKSAYSKDGDVGRDNLDGARFQNDFRDDFERSSNTLGRNDVLKRGWSFPAPESHLNRDGRYASPNNRVDRDGFANGRAYFRDGNNARHDASGRDAFSRDVRSGSQQQQGGQWQESKFGKDVFAGRQGFSGSVSSPGPRMGVGPGFSYSGSDMTLPSKAQSGLDFKREKRVPGLYGQVHNEDPFLGDGIGYRPNAFYVSQPKMKKDSSKADDYRDPARESFEAELERVEKMLELERQRAVEERERAIELARKEQEEQERLAREEEELRLKLEEEAREAAYRAQREAEEAARKIEELRKAREEEKRMAELEEERRKEAARRKLLELEERMAKRELEKRQEEASQKERGSTSRTVTEVSMDKEDNGLRKSETNSERERKLFSPSSKLDQDSEQVLSKAPAPGNTILPSIRKSPSVTPFSKDENGLSSGGRFAQTWKRDSPISGHEVDSVQKGPPRFLHLRTDRSYQQENEEQQQLTLFRNASARRNPVTSTESRASDDADEREWWIRDGNRSSYPTVANPQSPDLSEYPSYGRLRQSLPKQPRVLPPPPGNTVLRKQASQSDETQSGSVACGMRYVEGLPPSKEENRLSAGDESVGPDNQDFLVADARASEQFDSVPSEEVVLSDAGSQFSDDTIEDVAVQTEQVQETHSDVVSDTYPDREVDEISDLTEAQESSEDFELHKPVDWEVSQGDENQDTVAEFLGDARAEVCDSSEGQTDLGTGGPVLHNKNDDKNECKDVAQNAKSSPPEDDSESPTVEGPIHDVSISEQEEKQMVVLSEVKDGEVARTAEELSSEKKVQDEEMQSFLNQAPFPPVGTSDAAQVSHFEGVSSRQSVVQQFQQPFSFMAVPLPQSGTLNHVGASLPTLSSVHTLPNQQELPFHLQLGLLPSVPVMPNAIQIGSIQMPLHIHPQITHLNHMHGHQQAPVFQFGQIGPSLAISQPIPMTHMPQSAIQVHPISGQTNPTQHHQLQAEVMDDVDSIGHVHNENLAVVEATPIGSMDHPSVQKEHAEATGGPIGNSTSSLGAAEREIELPVVEPETEKSATDKASKLDIQTDQQIATAGKPDPAWVSDGVQADYNGRNGVRPLRGSRRRSNPLRHQGLMGRGRGRFRARGGHHYSYQASHMVVESRVEGGMKKVSRGKLYRRNYRRTEYRVREPVPPHDADAAAPDAVSGLSSNMEEGRESGGYRYVRRGQGGQPTNNGGDEKGQLIRAASQSSSQIAANLQPPNQSVVTTITKAKKFLRKYEVDSTEDAAFRTGVVCVFEQPGIETPNDKDDFIKVRSKRQLLRELREQREKEIKTKTQDAGTKEQVVKKQQRSSAKTVASTMLAGSDSSKNFVKRRATHNDGKCNVAISSNGTTVVSTTTSIKRDLNSTKPGRAALASKTVTPESESITISANENHTSEHLTTAAWGGQRSNQEVVSLTQIQLEEAMKPFRLDVPFSDSVCSPEKSIAKLDCSSSLSVEKAVTSVKASGPLSSLLAGEKIQFGAVTSPTVIPPDNCSDSRSPTPVSNVRTGSSIDFGSDTAHISSHTSSFVTGFLDSHLDATFSLKGDSGRKDDGYEGKVVDLEAEAAAEAAATAVVAAAISSEDPMESHSNTRVSEMNVGCSTVSSGPPAANTLSGQVHSNCASDNPIAVALPADLSVETPPSLFQGSSVTLSTSSGIVLQSLQGGTPTFPCLEMGPLIGGPVFNFGPREDAPMASVEPGLSGWQQRHVGTPDSFYGAPPFLSPAGLSSIQGHPHMLVYTNPYTPMGQFGQLGVSFMGTAYHPSGKQPDWTHVPIPSASSGALAMNDGDLSSGSNGLMGSQHLNGASNLIPNQRAPIAGPSVMSVASAPNLFDTGFAAPFQVPQMDGLVQSHWSKAPAPPVHNVSVSGPTLPLPSSRPVADHTMHVRPPRVHSNQGGLSISSMDTGSGFQQLSVVNPVTGSSFTPADACRHFPDELGLGDTVPTISNLQSDGSGPLSDAGHLSSRMPLEAPGIRVPRGQRLSRSSQGHLNSANGNNHRDVISNSNYQEQNRKGLVAVESQNKTSGRIGSPSLGTSSIQIPEQRTSKQALLKDNPGGEWARGSQRKGASGRGSASERGGSVLPAKLKQIYVAKPAGDSRKVGAPCS